MQSDHKQFGFGIETEHCLVNERTFNPLFHEHLPFGQTIDLLDGIDFKDFTSGRFQHKPLHRLASPYLAKGYYLTDEQMRPFEMLVKGVAVRTPIERTTGDAVAALVELTERLRLALSTQNRLLCSISHHPTRSNFEAPRNYKRDDCWNWALTAMTTYGADINISVPDKLLSEVQFHELGEKINYYLPYVVALSFASPVLDGSLWSVNGTIGKSARTYRRSLSAPLYYVHTEPAVRFEFKAFEMAIDPGDYEAFFLVCLSMLLDKSLNKRASNEQAISELRRLAVTGLTTDEDRHRAATVLASAKTVASRFDFDPSSLMRLWSRLNNETCPADQIVATFRKTGTIQDTMRSLAVRPVKRNFSRHAMPQVHLAAG